MDISETSELIEKLKNEEDVLKKAKIISVLRREKDVPINTIAEVLGKHPSYISHFIRLLRLPHLVIDGYYAGSISATHLMILSRLQSEDQMVEAYEEVLKKSLSVFQTETLVRQLKFDVASDTECIPPKTLMQEAEILQDKLEARVRIYQSRVRAKILIEKRGNGAETTQFIEKICQKLNRGLLSQDQVSELD